jgi:phosphohistidine phosphatase
MRRLYLLRHAKSSWEEPRLADHDRPLSERGRRAAAAMAGHCDRTGVRPDVVLCSSAVRARETLAGVLPGLGSALQISVEDDLYTFEARDLLERIQRVDDPVGSVMVIAHNPGIEVLAGRLAADGPDLERLRAKYPTAGLATIDLDVEAWREVATGSGHLNAFVTPADLVRPPEA